MLIRGRTNPASMDGPWPGPRLALWPGLLLAVGLALAGPWPGPWLALGLVLCSGLAFSIVINESKIIPARNPNINPWIFVLF